jgi:hypothetical protein
MGRVKAQPLVTAPQRTWRHRTVTYMNAAGSLVVGYRNVHRLDEWRMAIKSALRGASTHL